MSLSHEEQRQKWEQEHREPYALKQMDAEKHSSSLEPFVAFLEEQGKRGLVGLEMGCGKGRNVIWLARQPLMYHVYGFDFSQAAIQEAEKRARTAGVADAVAFRVMDATAPWHYADDFFDFVIDCTASTDIETPEGRTVAIEESYRVLKPGGYLLVYVMSTDDEYHKMLIERSPADEQNAFIHPETGKFEKVFSDEELDPMYKAFTLIRKERVEKTATFFGKNYFCRHHWRVYQKPA